MKSVNTAWCPHDYKKSSPLDVRWTRVTHPMGTGLTEEDQIAHAFGRLSLFFTAHAFRRLSFIHFACVFAHVCLDVSFFPLRILTDVSFIPLSMRSVSFLFRCLSVQTSPFFPLRLRLDVSLFISAVHPFSRLLVMKSREKRPGMLLKEVMRDSLLKALPKISNFRPKYVIFPIFQQRQLIKKKRTYLISVPGNRKYETITLYRTQKVKILSKIQD